MHLDPMFGSFLELLFQTETILGEFFLQGRFTQSFQAGNL